MKTVKFISRTGYKFYLNRTSEELIKISESLRALADISFYDSMTIDLSKENTNVLSESGSETKEDR